MRRSLLALCCLILPVGVLPLDTTSPLPSAPRSLGAQQPTSQPPTTGVPPTPGPTASAPTTVTLPQVSTAILPSNHTNTDLGWMVANRRYRAYFVNTLLTSDTLLFVNHNGFTYSEALQEWDWTNLIQETDYLNPLPA